MNDPVEFFPLFLGRPDRVIGRTERQVIGIEGLMGPGLLCLFQKVGEVVEGTLRFWALSLRPWAWLKAWSLALRVVIWAR